MLLIHRLPNHGQEFADLLSRKDKAHLVEVSEVASCRNLCGVPPDQLEGVDMDMQWMEHKLQIQNSSAQCISFYSSRTSLAGEGLAGGGLAGEV